MKPSRTRQERSQPVNQYLSDQQLKVELHRQAQEKKLEKKIEQIQEKEQILKHHQNYNLAKQQPEQEQQITQLLYDQQQQLQREIQETIVKNPNITEQQKQALLTDPKKEKERLDRLRLREEERLRRTNGLTSAFDDKKEPLPFQLERQLKENINNNNNKNNYLNNNEYDVKRTKKEELFIPIQAQIQLECSNHPSSQNQMQYYQQVQVHQPQFQHQAQVQHYQEEQFNQKRQTQENQRNFERNQVTLQSLPPRAPSQQRLDEERQAPISGQSRRSEKQITDQSREIQKKYKEELDQQIQQKQQQQLQQNFKPYSQQSTRSHHNINQQNQQNDDFYSKFGQDQPQNRQRLQQSQRSFNNEMDQRNYEVVKLQDQLNKQQYANELMDQILSKEQQRKNIFPVQEADQSIYQQELINDQQKAQLSKLQYKALLDKQIEEKRSQGQISQLQSRRNTRTNFQQEQTYSANQEIQNPIIDVQQRMFNNEGISPVSKQSQRMRQEESNPQNFYPVQNIDYQDATYQVNQIDPITPNTLESKQSHARKTLITSQTNPAQQEIQKQQKQQYADSLRQQVEERSRQKKEAERLVKEQDMKEQQRIEKELQEEKLKAEQTIRTKNIEVFEHQVSNKNQAKKNLQANQQQALRKDQNRQEAEIQNERSNTDVADEETQRAQRRNLLFDDNNEQQLNTINSQPRLQQHQQPVSSYDKLQQDLNQPQRNQFNEVMQNNNYLNPVQQVNNPFLSPMQVQFDPIFTQNQNYQQNLLVRQQGQPNFYDQINQYQNVLFNQNPNMLVLPQHMQVHSNYLLQLQQNKQEIEMVRQILEEKLRIQQIEMQNQLMVEQYKVKVRDIKQEQALFEREIQKLKLILRGQKQTEPLNPQVFTSALYMSIMGQGMNHKAENSNLRQNQFDQFLNQQQRQLQQQNSQQFILNNNNQQQGNPPTKSQSPIVDLQYPYIDNQVKTVHHLLPAHAQTKTFNNNQQKPTLQKQDFTDLIQFDDQDIELPASSNYVAFENNSIWDNLQVQSNKSYMPDFQNLKSNFRENKPQQQEYFPQSNNFVSNLDEFYMISSQQNEEDQELYQSYVEPDNNYGIEPSQNSHIGVDGFDVNMLRTQDYLNMFKQNIQSQSRRNNNTLMKMLEQNGTNLDDNINKPLFKEYANPVEGEFSQYEQEFVYPSHVSKDMQVSQKTNAVSQFHSKIHRNIQQLSSVQENEEQSDPQYRNYSSQLAVSGTMPISQLQKAQEVLMSDAKFNNDPNSLILPEDDIDEDRLHHFINSQEEEQNMFRQNHHTDNNQISKINFQKQEDDEHQDLQLLANLSDPSHRANEISYPYKTCIQKPLTSYHENPPQTPMSNYMSGRSDQESISSKKYKKPKTIDIFAKVKASTQMNKSNNRSNISNQYSHYMPYNDQQQLISMQNQNEKIKLNREATSEKKNNELSSYSKQPVPPQAVIREEHIQTPEPTKLIQQIKQQQQQKSPYNNDEVMQPLPSNIYSNCTQLNPLTSQTTFLQQDRRAEQIMNRLDNFLSQMEQSQDTQNIGKGEGSQLFQSKRLITTPTVDLKLNSRKAREISFARKEDQALNQLDILRESSELTPNSKQGCLEDNMFKYEDEP